MQLSDCKSFSFASFAAIGCFDIGKDKKCGLCAVGKVNGHFKRFYIMCLKVFSEVFSFYIRELNFYSDFVLLCVVASEVQQKSGVFPEHF